MPAVLCQRAERLHDSAARNPMSETDRETSPPTDSQYRLTATFEFTSPGLLLAHQDEHPKEAFLLDWAHDGFEVQLVIPFPFGTARHKSGDVWIHECETGSIAVARSEAEMPPPTGSTAAERNTTFQQRLQYFDSRHSEFERVARIVVSRLAKVLRFRLCQTLEGRISLNPQARWTDTTGVTHDAGSIRIEAMAGPKTGRFGETPLGPSNAAEVCAGLTDEPASQLYEEFLVDFRSSVRHGSLRRAVVELAIACEIFVKTACFGPNTRASRVFDVLENKRQVEASVLDLVRFLGDSSSSSEPFQKGNKADLEALTELFQARNKVVHRGQLVYRDKDGAPRGVDRGSLERWYESFEALRHWIQTVEQ
jgi:hypothetical protein